MIFCLDAACSDINLLFDGCANHHKIRGNFFDIFFSVFLINLDFSSHLVVVVVIIARNFIEYGAVLSCDHEPLGCVHCKPYTHIVQCKFVSFHLSN